MSDENQQTTQPTDTSFPASTNDSPVVEMPSEAPEAPTSVVDTPLVNNDNSQPITPEEIEIVENSSKK